MANASQPNNSYRPDLEKGNSNFDVRHRFVWMWSYTFPTREGLSGETEQRLGIQQRNHLAGRPALPPELLR